MRFGCYAYFVPTKENAPPAAQNLRRNRQRKKRCKANDNFLITVRFSGSFVALATVLFVAKGADIMPKRRANGEGNIRKRKDGRWEGRYTVGHDPETGKAIIKNVLGKTQAEVKEKLKKAIEENVGIDYGRAKTYTVGSWLEVWMENYAKIKLRPSTFKTSQGFLKNHIKPQIGSIPLADLTSLDLQRDAADLWLDVV